MRILIADDDPVIRKQLEVTLSKYEYEVIICADGLEAWEKIQSDDAPNLMILDWSMSGFNGLELCQKTRALGNEPEPYIILLTAKSDVNDVIEGLDSGADDYITKPFYPHELQARLKTGLRSIKLQEELIEARNMLEIEASHDYLTGILNRRAVIQSLQSQLYYKKMDEKTLSIIHFDLDHFKAVNDSFGHAVGDEILCETTRRISLALKPQYSFGRYGGEDFLLVLPECEYKEANAISERIRTIICDKDMDTQSGLVCVSISLGVCVFSSQEEHSIEKLVQVADNNLYKAKEDGRNRVRIEKV